jgi:hypothetical protein
MSGYLANLGETVSASCGCECSHLLTSRVIKSHEDLEIFDGEIETFILFGHPAATKAFAWAFAEDEGGVQHIVILNLPPINNPTDAVMSAIASGQF